MKPPKAEAAVIQADARALPLPDGSVDLVVTSPPYFALRDYQGAGDRQIGAERTVAEYVDALLEATVEMVRVLKPAGSIWVNLGDKYAGSGGHNNASFVADGPDVRGSNRRRRAPSVYQRGGQDRSVRAKSLMGVPARYAIGCIDKLGLILRAEVVWSKTCALPESCDDRVRRTHEVFMHFTTAERYYCNRAAIRQPYAASSKARDAYGYSDSLYKVRHGAMSVPGAAEKFTQPYPGTRDDGTMPTSVWEAPTAKRPLNLPADLADAWNHAAFPTELPARIIAGWCPPDGLVLDPFGGNGTTSVAARALGRLSISSDLSPAAGRMARWRVYQSGLTEALRGEQGPARQVTGQAELLTFGLEPAS